MSLLLATLVCTSLLLVLKCYQISYILINISLYWNYLSFCRLPSLNTWWAKEMVKESISICIWGKASVCNSFPFKFLGGSLLLLQPSLCRRTAVPPGSPPPSSSALPGAGARRLQAGVSSLLSLVVSQTPQGTEVQDENVQLATQVKWKISGC